jgi:hypothetical protein
MKGDTEMDNLDNDICMAKTRNWLAIAMCLEETHREGNQFVRSLRETLKAMSETVTETGAYFIAGAILGMKFADNHPEFAGFASQNYKS